MFLTEKEGGSDVGQCTTVAKKDGDVYRLYGSKWFCSNVDADVVMILARPEGAGPGTRGLGLFLLPKTLPNGKRNGYRIDRIKDKLGVRSMPTGEVTLDGAEAYLLGGPGQGFHQMTEMLNLSRLYNAMASVSLMRRSLLEAVSWADGRVAFGKKLTEHPLMQEMLLDLAAEQRGALLWAFRCVELLDKVDGGKAATGEKKLLRMLTPMLKYYTAKKCMWASSEGLEVLGGNGFIEDWPMARVLRDAQVLPIWEGSSNVLVLDAFRAIRKESAHEAFFAELDRLAAEAPSDLQPRLAKMREELTQALLTISTDPAGPHLFRDWTDRASLAWEVAVLCAKSCGAGTDEDVRAAKRILARTLPETLLRTDRAGPDEFRRIAFS
jgi:alkylation response protein AidB-like acyl-CoA dehydrogenase